MLRVRFGNSAGERRRVWFEWQRGRERVSDAIAQRRIGGFFESQLWSSLGGARCLGRCSNLRLCLASKLAKSGPLRSAEDREK